MSSRRRSPCRQDEYYRKGYSYTRTLKDGSTKTIKVEGGCVKKPVRKRSPKRLSPKPKNGKCPPGHRYRKGYTIKKGKKKGKRVSPTCVKRQGTTKLSDFGYSASVSKGLTQSERRAALRDAADAMGTDRVVMLLNASYNRANVNRGKSSAKGETLQRLKADLNYARNMKYIAPKVTLKGRQKKKGGCSLAEFGYSWAGGKSLSL